MKLAGAFFIATLLLAQDAVPEALLAELKGATVYVKVNAKNGQTVQTGSGFLMRTNGDQGYLVTNSHVITSGLPEATVEVVFNSGQGKTERALKAEVVGDDPSRDLAILKIEAKDLPKPIDIHSKVKPRETLPVLVLGFPFGAGLATAGDNPAMSISRGSISSLRNDPYGNPEVVQLDGDINPGNSGGPVVDKSGALVGVTVAKIVGTQIGFAIPPRDLDEMLQGRVGGITITPLENKGGLVKIRLSISVIDPMKKMGGVSITWAPRAKITDVPAADDKGAFPPIKGDLRTFSLRADGKVYSGDLTLNGEIDTTVPYIFQLKYARADGRTVHCQADQVGISFSKDATPKPPPKEASGPTTPPARSRRTEDEADDWLADRRKRPSIDSLSPADSGVSAIANKSKLGTCDLTRLSVPGNDVPGCMVWSDNGAFVYVLRRSGTIHKIAVADLKEERKLQTFRSCAWMAMSKEGLLVASDEAQELWIIHPQSLSIRKRIPVGQCRSVAAAPPLGIAFVQNGDATLVTVDLASGKVVSTTTARDLWDKQGGDRIRRPAEGHVSFDRLISPVVTPDGKYLLVHGFHLNRFKIEGKELVYEEHGATTAGQGQDRTEVSSDSRYVCSAGHNPNRGGNSAGHPRLTQGVYIYKIGDLQSPVMSLEIGQQPSVLGYDKAAQQLYSRTQQNFLMVFSNRGEKLMELPATGVIAAPDMHTWKTNQLLVHPAGRKLLAATTAGLFWVDIPK